MYKINYGTVNVTVTLITLVYQVLLVVAVYFVMNETNAGTTAKTIISLVFGATITSALWTLSYTVLLAMVAMSGNSVDHLSVLATLLDCMYNK